MIDSSKVCKSNLTLTVSELRKVKTDPRSPVHSDDVVCTCTVFIAKYQSDDVVHTLYTSIHSSLISSYVYFLFIPFWGIFWSAINRYLYSIVPVNFIWYGTKNWSCAPCTNPILMTFIFHKICGYFRWNWLIRFDSL